MATKAEGVWGCTVLSGRAGKLDGIATVQINVQITEGPSKGQRCTYEDTVNTRSSKYIDQSCAAVGWKGRSLVTLEADIAEWIEKTGGASTVEIKHLEVKKGPAYDKWYDGGRVGPPPVWDKVSGIGRGQPRALAPLDGEALMDADEAMRSVNGNGAPPEDAPHAATTDEDSIPF